MEVLFMLPGALFAPAIHEFTKAVTGNAQGDPTPRDRGFLTVNPLRFFEPIGFFMILFFGGLGWGQPVPANALYYRNRRRGVILTALVPVGVNLLVGMVTLAGLSLWVGGSLEAFLFVRGVFFLAPEWDIIAIVKIALFFFAQCNVMLALFNLLPVHPLAASGILRVFAKPDTLVKLNHYEKPMQIIMVLLLFFGFLGIIFVPLWNVILRFAWLA